MVRILSTLATCLTAASATMMPAAQMGQMGQMGQMWQGGNLMGASAGGAGISVSVGITIIAINNGGGSQWQQVNQGMGQTGKTIQVTVGGTKGLVYTPPTVNAEVGDMVQFNFMSKNHTVTQSTFPVPCKKMTGGLDSGFQANLDNTMPPPAFKMQVMTKDPLWFYCRQKTPTSHCGAGMVFSINPTADKTQDAFVQAAMAQNGTSAGSMTAAAAGGSTTTIVASPAAAAATTMAMAPPAAAAPPASAAPPAAAAPPMVQGSGSTSGGSCSCSCLCGVAAFPAGAGIGMVGGMSGAMPMVAM